MSAWANLEPMGDTIGMDQARGNDARAITAMTYSNKTMPVLLALSLILAANATPLHGDVGDQVSKLLANGGASGDSFGYSVALNGSTALVGANQDDDMGSSSGSAYLIDTGTGLQLAKLLASDGVSGDNFGWAVDLTDSTAVVGAPRRGDNGSFSGAAYLFDVATGLETYKLLPASGQSFDQFGYSVALEGTTAVIGAPGDNENSTDSGAVYLFDTTTGLQLAKLFALDGQAADNLGWSLATQGNTLVAGAPCDRIGGVATGSAYVFDLSTGLQIAKLKPSDGLPQDHFGWSVAVSGMTVLVGSRDADDNGMDSGSAYLFDLGLGIEVRKLLPTDGGQGDNFGYSAALDGTTAILGAWTASNGGGLLAGAAYLFDTVTGAQTAILLADDGAPSDFLGGAVAIDSAQALVGATRDDDNGLDSGSVYLFDASDPSVPASSSVRNGSGLNSSLFGRVSDPVLGASWDTDLDASGHAAAIAAVLVYEQPFSGVFVAGGELLLDLTSPSVLQLVLSHTGNVVRFSSAVPLDGSLFGFGVSAQGVVFGAPGYELSNALDLTLGF